LCKAGEKGTTDQGAVEEGTMQNVMPPLPGYTWRPLASTDTTVYEQLIAACAQADNIVPPRGADVEQQFSDTADRLPDQTIGLFDAQGRLSASGWITFDDRMQHEYRSFLDVQVAPSIRPITPAPEGLLLTWGEERTRQIYQQCPTSRPCVLRLDFYHQNQESLERYVDAGFIFALAEDEMRRDLSLPIAVPPQPPGVAFHSWSAELALAFFSVYSQAFRTRPGFPGWDEATWRHNLTHHDAFRPELSLLLLVDGRPAGFALSAVESDEADIGHIIQMGVIPAQRGQGRGSALLCEVMRHFTAADLRYAALDVNANNPQARRVYERNGFQHTKRFSSYRKTLS